MTQPLLFLCNTRDYFAKLKPLAAAARDAGDSVTFFAMCRSTMARFGMTRMADVGIEEFREDVSKYDLVASGGALDVPVRHLTTEEKISRIKQTCLIVDAAADAGNSFEVTEYQTFSNLVGPIQRRKFILSNNAASHLFSEAGKIVSQVVSTIVLPRSIIWLEASGFLNGSVE